jgi:hypothetical protein
MRGEKIRFFKKIGFLNRKPSPVLPDTLNAQLPKKSIGTVIIGGKRMFCNPLDADRTDDEKR